MKHLFKLFGIGFMTGAGTRAGLMFIDTAFPNGFKEIWGKLIHKNNASLSK
mgnify:CR=1 FL=1